MALMDKAILQIAVYDHDLTDADDYIGEVLIKLGYATCLTCSPAGPSLTEVALLQFSGARSTHREDIYNHAYFGQ